jgi:S1-C subfamily serine protease
LREGHACRSQNYPHLRPRRARNIIDEDEMSAFGLPGVKGVLVLEVPAGSPLAKAGLRKNDVILSVNGGTTAETSALLRHAAALRAGNSLKIGVSRDQKELAIQLVQ